MCVCVCVCVCVVCVVCVCVCVCCVCVCVCAAYVHVRAGLPESVLKVSHVEQTSYLLFICVFCRSAPIVLECV